MMTLFQDGKVNKQEVLKNVPLMLRGLVSGQIDNLNNVDFNNNGQADVAELINLVVKVGPALAKMGIIVDMTVVAEKLADQAVAWLIANCNIPAKQHGELKACVLEILKELLAAKASLEAANK
jgi:predicted ABC-class ATPase